MVKNVKKNKSVFKDHSNRPQNPIYSKEHFGIPSGLYLVFTTHMQNVVYSFSYVDASNCCSQHYKYL